MNNTEMTSTPAGPYYRPFHRKRCKTFNFNLGVDVLLFFLRNLIILLVTCHLLNVACVVVDASVLSQTNRLGVTDWQIALSEEKLMEFVTDVRVTLVDDIIQHEKGSIYDSYRNFTSLIYLREVDWFIALASGKSIIKLKGPNFKKSKAIDVTKSCDQPLQECESRRVNVISNFPSQIGFWFCFLTPHNRPALYNENPLYYETACYGKRPFNLNVDISFGIAPQYTSPDPNIPPSVLTTSDGFVYLGTVDSNGRPLIRKLRAPDSNKIFDIYSLSTTAKHFPDGKTTFLVNFESRHSIYFVVRQEVTRESIEHPFQVNHTEAHLIRLCKSDGGLNGTEFASFKRARLTCVHKGFYYNNIIAASWNQENKQLYATFATQKGSPLGSAVCAFSENDINSVYNNRLKKLSFDSNTTDFNKYPNLCNSFTTYAVRLFSSQHLDTYYPIKSTSLYQQAGLSWKHVVVDTFHREMKGNTQTVNVLYMATRNHVLRVVQINGEACPSELIKLNKIDDGESINQIMIHKRKYLLMATTKRLLSIPLHRCERYKSRKSCLRSLDPYCGWDKQNSRCVYTDSKDDSLDLPNLRKCKEARKWSIWSDCEMTERSKENYFEKSSMKCKCRFCLDDSRCPIIKQQISNCTKSLEWSEWSEWSVCSRSCGRGISQRIRSCRAGRVGSSCSQGVKRESRSCIEQETCPEANFNRWSRWTKWSKCSTECGDGFMRRSRTCLSGVYCFGSTEEYKTCSKPFCEDYESRSDWTPWMVERLGPNQFIIKRFLFTCNATVPSSIHTTRLTDTRVQTVPCNSMNIRECLRKGAQMHINQHGNWGTWSDWTTCSKTCGGGLQSRYRGCNNPPVRGGGRPCLGESKEERLCSLEPCNTSVWGCWGAWSSCSEGTPCHMSSGWQWRQRECLMAPHLSQLCKHAINSTVERQRCTPNEETCTSLISSTKNYISEQWSECNHFGFKIKQQVCLEGMACSRNVLEYEACPKTTTESNKNEKEQFSLVHVIVISVATALSTGILIGLGFIACQCCRSRKSKSQNTLNRTNFNNQNNLAATRNQDRNSNDVSHSSHSSISYSPNIQENEDTFPEQSKFLQKVANFPSHCDTQHQYHHINNMELRPFSSSSMSMSTRQRVSTPPSESKFPNNPPRPPRQHSPSSSSVSQMSIIDRNYVDQNGCPYRPPRPPRHSSPSSNASSTVNRLLRIHPNYEYSHHT